MWYSDISGRSCNAASHGLALIFPALTPRVSPSALPRAFHRPVLESFTFMTYLAVPCPASLTGCLPISSTTLGGPRHRIVIHGLPVAVPTTAGASTALALPLLNLEVLAPTAIFTASGALGLGICLPVYLLNVFLPRLFAFPAALGELVAALGEVAAISAVGFPDSFSAISPLRGDRLAELCVDVLVRPAVVVLGLLPIFLLLLLIPSPRARLTTLGDQTCLRLLAFKSLT
mmetsp:Transcript_43683/g.78949  ORF Transcript_43683/g.78949 Transcript_43683/m.78949 type:complete len:231 (+) Transcript_43683:444-1136(+)